MKHLFYKPNNTGITGNCLSGIHKNLKFFKFISSTLCFQWLYYIAIIYNNFGKKFIWESTLAIKTLTDHTSMTDGLQQLIRLGGLASHISSYIIYHIFTRLLLLIIDSSWYLSFRILVLISSASRDALSKSNNISTESWLIVLSRSRSLWRCWNRTDKFF